jgi:hypothetical protein
MRIPLSRKDACMRRAQAEKDRAAVAMPRATTAMRANVPRERCDAKDRCIADARTTPRQ